MKKTFILFLLTLNIYSQENILLIEYDVYYNTASPRVKKSFLSIENTTTSKYIELPEFKLLKNTEKKDTNFEKSITINYNQKGLFKSNYIDLKKKKISSVENMFYNHKIFKVNEELPVLKWDISNKELKKIGKYTCNKATVYFRGRTYIAWYTKEIGTLFGPWKLYGTPGLILEAYDTTLKYRWIAKRIGNSEINFKELSKKVKFDTEINIKDFITEKYGNKKNRIDKRWEVIKSKLPRGTKVKMSSVKKRQVKELIFEWEEKN